MMVEQGRTIFLAVTIFLEVWRSSKQQRYERTIMQAIKMLRKANQILKSFGFGASSFYY